jgi:hypothetical protein
MDEFLFLCKSFALDELVQAGGGNISVKIGTFSIIKTSGVALSDVTSTYGHTVVNHEALSESLSGEEPDLTSFSLSGQKPSIEAYFHSFLKKYTVHIHPTVMLPYLCAPCPGAIPYCKPGFELSKRIKAQWDGDETIYLQNHGVIFTSDSMNGLLNECHRVYEHFRKPGYISLIRYWELQRESSGLYIYKLSLAETRAYLPILAKHNIRKITPDVALFLYDSVRIEDNMIFIQAPNKDKCLAMLEVLRSYCEVIDKCSKNLTEMEVAEIVRWPSEKHRLTIGRGT